MKKISTRNKILILRVNRRFIPYSSKFVIDVLAKSHYFEKLKLACPWRDWSTVFDHIGVSFFLFHSRLTSFLFSLFRGSHFFLFYIIQMLWNIWWRKWNIHCHWISGWGWVVWSYCSKNTVYRKRGKRSCTYITWNNGVHAWCGYRT